MPVFYQINYMIQSYDVFVFSYIQLFNDIFDVMQLNHNTFCATYTIICKIKVISTKIFALLSELSLCMIRI